MVPTGEQTQAFRQEVISPDAGESNDSSGHCGSHACGRQEQRKKGKPTDPNKKVTPEVDLEVYHC